MRCGCYHWGKGVTIGVRVFTIGVKVLPLGEGVTIGVRMLPLG